MGRRLRLLICGGRNYTDRDHAFSTLDALDAERPVGLVIVGGAAGADALGFDWAYDRGREWETYPANWKKDGKAAGPIRNQKMLEYGMPDLVVAFPGGRGTADMVRRARAASIEVIAIPPAPVSTSGSGK